MTDSDYTKALKELTPDEAETLGALVRQSSRAVFYRTMALVAIVLLGVVGFVAASQYSDAKDAAEQAKEAASVVRNAALENCQKSIRPGGVRFIIASGLQQEIAQSKAVDYHQLFPNLDPKQLHDLLDASTTQRKQEVHDLLAIDCAAQFPKP